ncbi:MAG: hypothetical protein R3C43_07175 [Chloroflexota bacterium]
MSLSVLPIDPADTYHSVRDRLLQLGRGRTVLVMPEGRVPLSGIDLVLLRRLADRERLEVGLVASDRQFSRQARALGLPTFANLTLAEHYRPGWWRAGRRAERLGFAPGEDHHPWDRGVALARESRSAERRRLIRPIVLLAGVVALGLLAIAGLYALPRAEITLRPATLPAQVILDLLADENLNAPSDNALPARSLEHVLDWEATGLNTTDATTDAQRIKSQALQGIGASAAESLTARLDPEELLVPSSIHVEISDEMVERSGDQTTLWLRVTLSGSTVASADVDALAYRALSAALPTAYVPDPATLRVQLEPANGEAPGHFQVTAQATGRTAVDTRTLSQTLAGRQANEAARFLSTTIPLAEPPAFVVRPGWWWDVSGGRLPLRAEQITVELAP